MCEHGDTVALEVTVSADLAFEGVDTRKVKPIDRCIAPLVKALNDGGMTTVASCCGHGRMEGTVVLADGRDLRITKFNPANYTKEPPMQTYIFTVVVQGDDVQEDAESLRETVIEAVGDGSLNVHVTESVRVSE